MKKITLLVLLSLSIFTLSACDKELECPDGQSLNKESVCVEDTFTITFDSKGGSAVAPIEVSNGSAATAPTEPTKDAHNFVRWYTTDETVSYDFSVPPTDDLTLNAKWAEQKSDAELLQEDIDYIAANLMTNPNQVNLYDEGPVNGSDIYWLSTSDQITNKGIVLPLEKGADASTGTMTGIFTYNDEEVTHAFTIDLTAQEDVTIATSQNVAFENLTTEWDVEDGALDLYFEDGGSVPYVKLTDFFTLLAGFIDVETVFESSTTDGVLTIEYDYVDEDDVTFDLILTVDSVENTLSVNDPGFFWAYVYSVETNFGRHIVYEDHPDASLDEGDDIIYDLDLYNMDVPTYDGDVLVPFHVANQLFVTGSYYNVYYNVDGLYGVYYVPESDSDEAATILTSQVSGSDVPLDLAFFNFNMLAFDLDYMYGLKDIKEVDTYYDLLFENRHNLVNTNPRSFESGLRYVLYKELDDPHTNYQFHSFYNDAEYEGWSLSSLGSLGTRYASTYNDGYFAVDDAVAEIWGESTDGSWNYTMKPNYWVIDSTSVAIVLNGFDTADIDMSTTRDDDLAKEVLDVTTLDGLLPALPSGNKYWYYNSSTQDDTILEIIVKGTASNSKSIMKDKLASIGATLVKQDTDEDEKDNGYYQVTVGGKDYMIQVDYSSYYEVLYVSVVEGVPGAYGAEWPVVADADATVESDSAVYMELMLEKVMDERPATKNITLDLTFNGGGNLGALYRVMGFITNNAFKISRIDRDTNGTSTSYVSIDSGIPSYASKNWSLLTSKITYSAANEMVAIFMDNNIGPVIGMQSGGGACSVTPILLPSGVIYTMSSNSIFAIRTGSGTVADPYVYEDTEFGFVPDYPLAITQLYDAATLAAILDDAF